MTAEVTSNSYLQTRRGKRFSLLMGLYKRMALLTETVADLWQDNVVTMVLGVFLLGRKEGIYDKELASEPTITRYFRGKCHRPRRRRSGPTGATEYCADPNRDTSACAYFAGLCVHVCAIPQPLAWDPGASRFQRGSKSADRDNGWACAQLDTIWVAGQLLGSTLE